MTEYPFTTYSVKLGYLPQDLVDIVKRIVREELARLDKELRTPVFGEEWVPPVGPTCGCDEVDSGEGC